MSSARPWETEGDGPNFFHRHGYQCCTLRVPPIGALCGYVKIPQGHPWFNRGYSEIESCEVHGGLTYSGRSPLIIQGVVTDWWIGFDCSHAGDLCPEIAKLRVTGPPPFSETYRDLAYVTAECDKLAAQAAAADPAAIARRMRTILDSL